MRPIRALAFLFFLGVPAVSQSVLDVDQKRDAGPPLSAAFSTGVFDVDFDADGQVDLLFGGEFGYDYNRRAALRRNLGDGRFEPVAASRYMGWLPVFAAADLDGDGTAEFAGEGGIWHIAPDGTIALAVSDVGGGAAAFGDVDGDGDLDVVRGGALPGGTLALFFQVAPLVFLRAPQFTAPHGAALDFGDLDGDGDLDLLVGRDGAPNGLYENDGSGVFTDVSHRLPGGDAHTVACALRDLNGDGETDVLLLSGSAGRAELLYQRNGVLVDASACLPIPAGDHVGLAIGDVDSDGYLDVVVASDPGGTVARGTATGWFMVVSDGWPGNGSNGGVALIDVDGDGDLDLVEAADASNDRVHFNDGVGRFVGAYSVSQRFAWSGEVRHRYAVAADIDHDGDVDVLTPQTLWSNDGFGRFDALPSAAPELITGRQASVASGDVDGDGWLDLVVPTAFDRFRVYHGDGRGGFRAGAEYVAPISPSNPNPPAEHQVLTVLALHDLDADGDLDLLCGATEQAYGPPPAPAYDTVWWNDGQGAFVEDRAWCTTGEQFRTDVAFGDLNGDGRVDFTDGDSSFVQRPDGRFDHVAPDPASWRHPAGSGGIALADLDRDGALDVVKASNCAGTPYCEGWPDVIGWNDGTGRLLRVALTGDRETHDVALLDADGDGDVDIFFGRVDNGVHGIGPDVLWINEGNRTFRPAVDDVEVPQVWRDTWQMLARDFDADGDVDVFTLGSASRLEEPFGVLWVGMTRHLKCPDLLRVGRPYAMELHGVVGGGLILGSPLTARVPLGPVGVLGVHPDAAVVLRVFGGPTAGRRSDLELTIPAEPVLAGVTYAFQGAVIDSTGALRLTNRVVETFLAD